MSKEQSQGKSNPRPSSEAALHRMKAAKPRDTAPEIAIRKELHRRGLRYRVDTRPLQEFNRRADIVFKPVKVAVFVDGCFWHGCPIHGTSAKANADFWRLKIERNKERDKDTNNKLKEAGWEVIRIWEHESPEEASEKIYRIVMERH
jgi:DNA mismatch endonuclease, patch repair protein